jgi:HPr kinase/phosphorylase
MNQVYTVGRRAIAEEHNLTVLHAASDYDTAQISSQDINRPGLQFAGFYDYFDPARIQIMGKVETTFLSGMLRAERERSIDLFMSQSPAAVVLAHALKPMPELMEAAKKHDVTLLASDLDTSEFMGQLIVSLRRHLAPRVTLHGVLMEVHGEGLLITGDSGVGKSETALALLKRGHRLIADDAVEVKRTSRTTLVGTAPEVIRYYMELRGIGVIDARHIFGIGAVKPSQVINLVVNFEIWDNDKNYDRLGIETEYTEILGVRVPYNNIPVRPGRNLAAILELAAMNNREKSMGYNAARSLVEKHDRMLEEQRRKNGT